MAHGKHGLFWFMPDFLDWPLAVVESLHKMAPASSFSALVMGEQWVLDRVRAWERPGFTGIDHLDRLQRAWLARPYEAGRLAEYEKILGDNAVNRILIADRQVGAGFVTGAVAPETPLIRATRSTEAQRRYLIGLLDYAFEVFEKQRPDYVFGLGVASAATMALVLVSRHFGVPFLRLTALRVGDRFCIDTSVDGTATPVAHFFDDVVADERLVADRLPEARKLIEEFRSRPEEKQYNLADKKRSYRLPPLRDFASLAWRTVTRREPEMLLYPYPHARLKWEIRRAAIQARFGRAKQFKTLAEMAGERFVYFPLHVEPEASTMVAAPYHTNQFAMVEALAKSIPADMLLAVKEHLPMVGKRRRDFYARLADLPRVVLLSPFESGPATIQAAALTCVVTGTAAWEAMVLRRPALFIGPTVFQAVGQGFVRCPDITELAPAILRALDTPPADDDRLTLFLAAVLAATFDFPRHLLWGQVTPQLVEKNPEIAENMARRILGALATPAVSQESALQSVR